MSFKIVHDLGTLNEAQRQQYLRDASEYLGLDPDLNGLDLIWINTNEGPSRLTAYARRGTTDILRKIHNISVTSLTQHDGPGYVSFTATGVQKESGRTEIAVGAAFLEGLKGDRIAASVATAQTRALRRLTLQFVGLAVLDESEVNAPVVSNPAATWTSSTPIPPQPSVAPSNEPGKDVTMIAPSQDPKTQAQVSSVIAIRDMQKIGNDIVNARLDEVTSAINGGSPAKTQEQFEAFQAKLRTDAIAQLNEKSEKLIKEIQDKADLQNLKEKLDKGTPIGEAIAQLNQERSVTQNPPPKKTRKPRGPNKPKVDLGPSEPVFDAVAEHAKGSITIAEIAAVAAPQAAIPPPAPEVVPTASVAPPAAPVVPGKPRLSLEQVRPFRGRLFKLVNDVLEPAGFTPREGMGNADKMRTLATIMFPDVTNMNELTIEQWEKYLYNLEYNVFTNGPAATVKYIEDTIGI